MKNLALSLIAIVLFACNPASKQESIALCSLNKERVIMLSNEVIDVKPGKEFSLEVQAIPGRFSEIVGRITWYLPEGIKAQDSLPGYIMEGSTKKAYFMACDSLRDGSDTYIAIETEFPTSSKKHISIWPLKVK